MAETLGSLCDKLTIVKLKQYHSNEEKKLESLSNQELQLIEEINTFLADALTGNIPIDRLSFSANKVYKKEGNEIRQIKGNMGEVFAELSKVNCDLWHEQEKVYDFESLESSLKDQVVKNLAILNLERNACIDELNNMLIALCK